MQIESSSTAVLPRKSIEEKSRIQRERRLFPVTCGVSDLVYSFCPRPSFEVDIGFFSMFFKFATDTARKVSLSEMPGISLSCSFSS